MGYGRLKMPDDHRLRALCVEGDPPALGGLPALLDEAGFQVDRVSWEGAPHRFEERVPDLVVLQGGGAGAGWEAVLDQARALRDRDVFVPVVLLAPRGNVTLRIQGLRRGADECLDPDGDREETLARVEALMRIKDIQDRMIRSRRDLKERAVADALTGVLARHPLHERCKEELHRARRYHDPLSVLLVDLDAFQDYNARHGELSGDAALKVVAGLLKEALRDIDIVGRQAGDTFCVLLPSTHLSGALTVAERVWRSVAAHPFEASGTRSRMTCSIGIAFFPARGVTSHEDLLRVAQEALHRAKREGKNRICLYQAAHYFYQPSDPEPGAG